MKHMEFIHSLTPEQKEFFDKFRDDIMRLTELITIEDINGYKLRMNFIELVYKSDDW